MLFTGFLCLFLLYTPGPPAEEGHHPQWVGTPTSIPNLKTVPHTRLQANPVGLFSTEALSSEMTLAYVKFTRQPAAHLSGVLELYYYTAMQD